MRGHEIEAAQAAMGHSEKTRLAYEGGARAAISMPDRPGLRRRARRRTSGPAYRRAGGFHDRTRLTDEDRTRVAMKRRRQGRAATRRQAVSQRIPARCGADRRRRGRCARDDFLTFSLYHLKIASNFQVSAPTSIRRKKTASTGRVDVVFVRCVGGHVTRWRVLARYPAAPPHAACRRISDVRARFRRASAAAARSARRALRRRRTDASLPCR